MKRSLSGIQPSGIVHIGNYFGAMKQFIGMQDSYEGFYFVADYHALTTSPDPNTLRENTLNVVLDYLAIGLNPEKSIIYLQSAVPEHTELAWFLMNVTPVSLLERSHSYKDKVSKGIGANHGLFSYPVLMAADILMYDPDVVPVGKDQKQHVEIARDIATKFNILYNDEVFKIPEPIILDSVSTIVGIDGQKMSKTYNNTIDLFASKKKLKGQIMKILTDSTPLESPKNPDNLISMYYSLFTSKDNVDLMKQKFVRGNYGYGHAKSELLEAMLEYFKDAREKREELLNNLDYVHTILDEGAKKARDVAISKIKYIKNKIGLLGNVY